MAAIANPHQRNAEWWRARRGKLTSSRMKTICHGGPKAWTTLIAKLRAEMESDSIIEPDLDHVPAIAHGRAHEPIALANVELDLGIEATLVGFVHHPTVDYVGCSSDWVLKDGDRIVRNGEIKCPLNLERHLVVYQTGRMPDEHRPQVQCQMFVHEVGSTYFTSFHPRAPHWKQRTVTIEVPRDEAYIEYMVQRCEQFWRAFHGETAVYNKPIAIPSLF